MWAHFIRVRNDSLGRHNRGFLLCKIYFLYKITYFSYIFAQKQAQLVVAT